MQVHVHIQAQRHLFPPYHTHTHTQKTLPYTDRVISHTHTHTHTHRTLPYTDRVISHTHTHTHTHTQALVYDHPGQNIEIELFDEDTDKDDFLGRYAHTHTHTHTTKHTPTTTTQ